MRRRRFGQTVQAVVARHTDDFEPGTAWPLTEPFSQRVLIRVIDARQGLVDDDDAWRIGVVAFGEAAPCDERNTQRFVIARSDRCGINRDVFAGLWLPALDHHRGFGDDRHQWCEPRGGSRLDTGQRLYPLDDLSEILSIALIYGAFARFIRRRRI